MINPRIKFAKKWWTCSLLECNRIERGTKLGLRRSASMGHKDYLTPNMLAPQGHKSSHKHVVGGIGEVVFSDYSGLPVDDKTIGRGDSGSDFPGGIQVKSAELDHPPNLPITVHEWHHKPQRIYVMVWIDGKSAHILGAITRANADKVKQRQDRSGFGESYWISFMDLSPVWQLVPPRMPANLAPAVQGSSRVDRGGNRTGSVAGGHLVHRTPPCTPAVGQTPAPVVFDPPRWPGGPMICAAVNLPAFLTRSELDSFRETNCPGSTIIKVWQCNVCDSWHYWASGHDPAGSSSGTTRTSRHIEAIARRFFSSATAKTINPPNPEP